MTISTLDNYIAAVKTRLIWMKTGVVTTVAAMPFSMINAAGEPGVGALVLALTASGAVPASPLAGYPLMPTITNTGYLTKVFYGSAVACTMTLYDKVFHCGSYNFNADTTLTAQPSYVSRMPGSLYLGTELWVEAATAFTGVATIQINYLNEAGAPGDTGAVSTLALTINRMFRIPLAGTDSGISQITRVRCTVASGGTFNVYVMRPLWMGRVQVVNDMRIDDILKTGMPIVYPTSALFIVHQTDGVVTSFPYLNLEISDK